jgi:Fe-S oxidoreductase
MLHLARRSLRQVLDVLAPYLDAGLAVVVPEPSCLAAFRDELPALLPDDPRAVRLSTLAVSLSQHLATRLDALPARPGRGRALVHPHCHGRAVGTGDADRLVLERLGYDVDVLDAGCCGLAGSFGYDARHEDVSRRIGEEQWLPRLREQAVGATLVVDGFSCALQLEQLDGRTATTLAEIVARSR